MKRGKKVLVLFLALVMLVTSVPAIAAAEKVTNPYTAAYTDSEVENLYQWFGKLVSYLFDKKRDESSELSASVEDNDADEKGGVSEEVYTDFEGQSTVVEEQNAGSAGQSTAAEEQNAGSEETNKGYDKKKKNSSTKNHSSEKNVKQELELVENETTVENGEMLRASTYNLNTVESATTTFAARDAAVAENGASTDVLKYFNTTLYDYDQTTINNATHKVEVDSGKTLTEWEGIYFNGGDPWAEAYSVGVDKVVPTYEDDGTAIIQEGDYLLVSRRSNYIAKGSDTGIAAVTEWSRDALWHVKASEEGTGYQVTNAAGRYMVIGSDTANCYTQVNKSEISIIKFAEDPNDAAAVMLKQKDGNQYLNQWGGPNGESFGGWSDSNDLGSVFYLYKISDDFHVTDSYEYAAWNSWRKKSTNADGQKMYTGLVENTLDANKDIVFTKPDGGIFNDDATVKDIYPRVEMPFVFNPETGEYSFDASVNGVYFKEDVNQESTSSPNITQDATGTVKYPRLYFDKTAPQSNGGTYGDGSTTVWMPFNNEQNIDGEGKCNYHFGMRTTIPFSMTSNGRVKETDTEDNPSAPIKFSFSGDDDVWVFIDGHLVIDLGGIHNRLDAEIDFEKNTVTYSESNNSDYSIASFNDSEFELTQKVFGNLIPQDRTTFAAIDNHELTIFYLERGAAASNCKIVFNLPVKDTLTVTKDATKSWAPDRDEQGNVIEGSEGTISPLTDEEQAMVDNIDFGFTLYRKTAEDDTFVAVNNTRYYLINPNGQAVGTPTTDSNGHFTLKNGYSARFISTDMDDAEGVTYYVAEDFQSGFVEPDYNYNGRAANGFLVNASVSYTEANQIPEKICENNDRTSDQVTVKGGTESQDSLVFICSNFLDAEMPNPSARPNDDMIVIDYGLPVEIDILANDLYRGESMSIENIYCVKPSTGGMEPLAVEGEETPAVLYAYDSAVLAKNAKANSEQNPNKGSDGPAAWAFDSDEHWWHSRWGGDPTNGETSSGIASESNKIWIQTGFDRTWYVDSLVYTPRQDGDKKGIIEAYTILVANLENPTDEPTDEDFKEIKTGTLSCVKDAQTIKLDSVVEATHVRLSVSTTYQDYDDNGVDLGEGYVAAQKIDIYGYDTDPTAQEPETGIPEAIEGQYGTLEYQDNGKFRYTLKKQLTGVEVFSYVVKAEAYDDEGNVTGQEYGTANLYIIPATSMYYEENFSGFNIDNTGAAIGMKYATATSSVAWADVGTPQTDCQEPGVVGTIGDSPYGSDKAYLNDSADSNGSSKYVDTTSGYAQFQYNFTGTGTAIMARVSKETGYIRVIVKQIMEDGTKEEVDRVFIDTMVLPPIEVTEDEEVKDIDTLYNIPVYDNYELDYGTYVVNVSVYKAGTKTSVADGSGNKFYLDGIKVYQPMDLSEPQSPETLSEFDWMTRNVALAAYATDAESDCTIVQLRDKLIEEYTVITEEVVEGEDGEEVKEKIEWNNDGFVTFTDTHGKVVEAEDYVSIGPKNEIYLNDGQEITFSLADWDINTGRLYLGMKAPEGTGTVQIGGRNISVNNATDCYYDISNYGTLSYVDVEDEEGNAYTTTVITFSIKAAAESLISVTNVKVTGIPEFVIVNNVDIDTEGEEGGDIEVPDEGGDDIEVPDEGGDDIEVPDEEEYVGPYTEEHPFVFPTELNELTILEAEYAELHNDGNTGTQENGVEKWQLGVKSADWASNGQFVNSLNNGDRITIPFVAEQAGTYTVTVQFRSGSDTNKLRWFSTDDIIVSGEQSAGFGDSTQTRTVVFTMTVAKTGEGVLTFAPVGYDSPQFDKLDIVLTSVAE